VPVSRDIDAVITQEQRGQLRIIRSLQQWARPALTTDVALPAARQRKRYLGGRWDNRLQLILTSLGGRASVLVG
jgi:hypothetical protein